MARNTTAYLTSNTSSRNDVNPFRSPKNSRVGSATRSVSQLSNRVSLQDFSTKMKARKIQLYRNGDPFFKGVTMAITQERFRTFNSLLSEVNKSALCDPSILQKGVRHIFSLHGEPIYDLDQLKDGHSYVCSSTPVFKRLKYESINSFNWYTSLRKVTPRNYEKLDVGERSQTPDCIPSQPKMVVVIRAGPRPRNMVRMLLNRRTATSFDQVLTHLAGALNMKTGTIRKMYMMTGPQVQDLSGFYTESKVFVAFESEKFSLDDLQMSDEEAKFVESACTNSRTTALDIVTPIIPIIRKPDYQSQSSHRVRSTASQPETRLLNFSTLAETCNVRPSSPALKPKVITVVNRGHSGENFGIPIPILAKYRIGRVLAQGDFVLVKRCYEKSRVTRLALKLALKIIDKSQLTQQEQSAVDCEVSLIRCLSHPNILRLMGELDTPSELYLIMEFIKTNGPGQGGYLLDAVVGHEHNEVEASVLLIQLCRALAYLHSLNIVHRNIRPDKIVVFRTLDGSRMVKLGDFGLATEVSGLLYKLCGTATYLAPEMLARTGYGVKVDVWAFGVIMYFLLSGHLPFGVCDASAERVLQRIRSGPVGFPAPYWDTISDSAKDMIMFIFEVDMSIRASASDLLDHPWLLNPRSIGASVLHPSVKGNIDVEWNYNENNHKQSDRVPLSWPKMKVKLVDVDKDSRNFDFFKELFLNGDKKFYKGIEIPVILGKMHGEELDLRKLLLVQNRPWLERFLHRKKQISREVGADEVNEKVLLHGTTHENALLISHGNFNRTFANKDGKYGAGNYCGSILGHVLKYTEEESYNWRCIIICRVLLGKSGLAKRGDFQPPLYGSKGNRCHSTVNNIEDPSVFVSYDDDNMFPCLIAYGLLRKKQ